MKRFLLCAIAATGVAFAAGEAAPQASWGLASPPLNLQSAQNGAFQNAAKGAFGSAKSGTQPNWYSLSVQTALNMAVLQSDSSQSCAEPLLNASVNTRPDPGMALKVPALTFDRIGKPTMPVCKH